MTLLLRLTLILMLGVAAWNPAIPWSKGPVDLFVVLDDSYSMSGKLDEKLWRKIRQQVRELPGRSRFALIRYGADSALEIPPISTDDPLLDELLGLNSPPRREPLNRSATNLEQALLFTARLIEPHRASTLLIVHDDQQTAGDAAPVTATLKQQRLRLLQMSLAPAQTPPDAWIQSVKAPYLTDHAQNIPVAVTVNGNRDMDIELDIIVNDRLQHKRSLHLTQNKSMPVQYVIGGCPDDRCLIKVQLHAAADSVRQNNSRSVAVTIKKPESLLFIGRTDRLSPFAATLSSSKIMVDAIVPDLCSTSADRLRSYAAVILDDIAVDMMPENCWLALDKAVRNFGLGLIVLGGSHSFAAGSYRHSTLENLLPVTAEASKQQLATTLLFLVDKSGSMDSEDNGSSRIALARQAIIDSMSAQSQLDDFGLISFDTVPHMHIPIRHYDDPAAEIRQAYNVKAKGGTRLTPALNFALQELDKAHADQRMLILVTDGFLDDQDLASFERRIADKKIAVVTLAIGNEVSTRNLLRLSKLNGGKLLHVDKIAELPLLMRKELDQRRNPLVTGPVAVKQKAPLPFMDTELAWPDLSAYMVTKAKPDSTVYLSSVQGDPLLAMHYAGIGKVVALPAGLEQWADNWLRWREWSFFVRSLVQWVSMSRHQSQLTFQVVKSAGKIELLTDVITPAQVWQTTESAHITINYPNGQTNTQALTVLAPGRYVTSLPSDQKGLYSMAIRIGEVNGMIDFFNDAIEEYVPTMPNDRPLSRLIPHANGIDITANTQLIPIRPWLLVGALILYLILILITINFPFNRVPQTLKNLKKTLSPNPVRK